jgi:hypothetical protein
MHRVGFPTVCQHVRLDHRAVAQQPSEDLRTAIRQLERAEDYVEGVSHLVPDLEKEIDQLVDDMEAIRANLVRRRLEA